MMQVTKFADHFGGLRQPGGQACRALQGFCDCAARPPDACQCKAGGFGMTPNPITATLPAGVAMLRQVEGGAP